MHEKTTTQRKRKVRAQLMLAALMWTAASVMLGVRGAGWLAHARFGLALAALALVLGWIKQRFVMRPVALGAIERIEARDPCASMLGFFSAKSWILVGLMMGGGIVLRLSGALPPAVLGILYAAVATGLLLGSGTFWIAAAHTG